MEEIKCDICGKTGFKSKAGLAGHKKIAHGADKRKTIPDEIGKRLKLLEAEIYGLACGIDTLTGALIKRFTGKEEKITIYQDVVEDIQKKFPKFLKEKK